MANFARVREHLEARGFIVSCFATAAEACDYLDRTLDGKSIGIGGSVTIRDMGLAERLGTHNRIVWHWAGGTAQEASETQIYLSSVNGLAETGEIINIDGTGNRVAALIYGPEHVIVMAGMNKVAANVDEALSRVHGTATPMNCKRLGKNTPCSATGVCSDCLSPDCICNQVVITRRSGIEGRIKVILIGEELGY